MAPYKTKTVLLKEEARNKVLKGAMFLADAVKLTLGPNGLNAITGLQNSGRPRITNDGYSIAKDISLNDPLEDLGVKVLREATSKTNDEAGDGTTTATLLASVITQEAMKQLPGYKGVLAGKKSLSKVIAQIKEETADVVAKLKKVAVQVKTKAQLIEIARVAVEHEGLAELIGGTQWEIGADGVIIVEETAETKDSIERIQGIRIDNGYASSAIINNPSKQSLELKDVHIILTNSVVHSLDDLKGVLQQALDKKMMSIVIVARAFSEEAIKLMAKNHEQSFFLYPVNAPYENQKEVMKDLSVILGATFFDKDERDLADITLADIGNVSRLIVTRWSATFAGKSDGDRKQATQARVAKLKEEFKGEVSEFMKRGLRTRISQLENGLAVLKIGALSETERSYKKDKADDAVNAVRAALQEGVVDGGGLALQKIGKKMPETAILKKALLAPHAQIMENGGEEFVIEDWVKDPVKVVRIGLERASSAACILATTAIAIDYDRELPMHVQVQDKPEGEAQA